MGAEVIILANPYTYNFLKGLTHSALMTLTDSPMMVMVIRPTYYCSEDHKDEDEGGCNHNQQVQIVSRPICGQ